MEASTEKLVEVPPCTSTGTSIYFHWSFHLLPQKWICFHLLPRKHNFHLLPGRLPATSIYPHLRPWKLPLIPMKVDLLGRQFPWKKLQLTWTQQTTSIYFHLPNETQDNVEANGIRSNSIWMLVEVTEKVDGSLCGSCKKSWKPVKVNENCMQVCEEARGSRWKSVEVYESRWK